MLFSLCLCLLEPFFLASGELYSLFSTAFYPISSFCAIAVPVRQKSGYPIILGYPLFMLYLRLQLLFLLCFEAYCVIYPYCLDSDRTDTALRHISRALPLP